MPLYDEYARSDPQRDRRHDEHRRPPGGACTAAMFLKEFAGDLPWAHLDIAGTAWADEAKPCQPKGPTGVAVRTLAELPSLRAVGRRRSGSRRCVSAAASHARSWFGSSSNQSRSTHDLRRAASARSDSTGVLLLVGAAARPAARRHPDRHQAARDALRSSRRRPDEDASIAGLYACGVDHQHLNRLFFARRHRCVASSSATADTPTPRRTAPRRSAAGRPAS